MKIDMMEIHPNEPTTVVLEETTICVYDLLRFILDARLIADTKLMPVVCRGRDCTEARIIKKGDVYEMELETPGTAVRQPHSCDSDLH
jgi:hypothetical protein